MPSANRPNLAPERGFSLIEAIVIVAISLILVAMTGKSMLDAMENFRVDTAARKIAALVQVAHLKAPARATRYRVAINTTTNRYRLERYNSGWEADPGADWISMDTNVVFTTSGISVAPPEVTSVSQAAETTFNTGGMLCDTSSGTLINGACFYLKGNTNRPAAICTNLVGRTQVYRLQNGAWNAQ